MNRIVVSPFWLQKQFAAIKCLRRTLAIRMQAVQNGRPARPQRARRLRLTFTVRRKEACDASTSLADFFNGLLASGHGTHNEKRLGPRCDRIG
jgi:hypothetical protein